MPYIRRRARSAQAMRRRKTAYRRRKAYKRSGARSYGVSANTTLTATGPGFTAGYPKTQIRTLRYTLLRGYDMSAAALYNEGFRANSIYDPLVASGGRTVTGYDQWKSFYNSYVVVRSRIVIQCTGSSNTSLEAPILVSVALQNDSSSAVSMTDQMAQPYTSWRLVSGDTGSLVIKMRNRFDAKTFFGIKDVKDDRSIGAEMTSDPSRLAYYNVFVGNVSTATVPNTGIWLAYTIEYDVMFRDPIRLTSDSI